MIRPDRLRGLVGQLERVLSLAESRLRDLVGGPPGREDFERHCAFRWDARERGRLLPIREPSRFELGDLVGVDRAVERLVHNTEQFVTGLPFNHVLLHGERGTGKSSAVRGLLDRFAGRGLRVVEVHRADLIELPRVLSSLRNGMDWRFLIFCDDLSFGRDESGFRELKAALEGSLESPPENVCVVATSNRRHLVSESMTDNRGARVDEEGELHLGESLEEKLALADRFGLVIGFYSFDQPTYLAIVEHYLRKAGIDVGLDQVRDDALRWALERSSRSGRTAHQFARDLQGRLGVR